MPSVLKKISISSVAPVSYQASGSADISSIAQAALPSVVAITNKSVQEVQNWAYFFNPFENSPFMLQESTSAGSGVIVRETDDSLYIVTNYHVVKGANTLSATFCDDESYEVEYVGGDEANDIALLKISLSVISQETKKAISVASIGDSDQLEIGEQVIAIGNALGYGQSVTSGVVSAVNRTLDDNGNTYIQTDAAINPGNSGGALLDSNGNLVGINSAKLASTEVEGMGYAIPMSKVASIISEIMGTAENSTPTQSNSQSFAA